MRLVDASTNHATMPNMEKQLYEIPAANIGTLEGKLAKLNKKAKKAGTEEIRLVRVGRRVDDDSKVVYIVAIEGETVKFKGYTFIARLDHNVDTSGESNLVYSMPGEELPDQYRDAAANCDHCKWRRNRKDTFILRKDATLQEASSLIQVGRTCLKDFFGHDPAEVARRLAYIVKLHDECREATGPAYVNDRRHIDTEEFLSFVSKAIREHGWVSGSAAWQNKDLVSTKDIALDEMFPYAVDGRTKTWHVPTNADRETADKALVFVKTMDPTKSDFNFNIVQIAKMLVIDSKAAGTAAAIIYCYNRHLENEEKKAAAPDLSGSEYVGEEKERLTLDVTILGSRLYNGDFGSYYVTRMLDAAGNLFVSFGSYREDVDSKVTIRGTVKRHQEYNGVHQTILNRVKAS